MGLINDEKTREKYNNLFNTCVIKPEKQGDVNWCVGKIIPLKDKYEKIAAAIGCPWWLIGLIHGMESSFKIAWLANGDSLNGATVNVPPGLIVPGKTPPYDFVDAAIVSLKHEGWDKRDWSVFNLGSILIELEKYNGSGYANRGLNSPYLWSFTNHGQKGRYVKDGVFDPNSWSNQVGCCAMLKELVSRKIVSFSSETPKKETVLHIGDEGEEVKSLQILLTANGFPCGSIDGDFGPKTKAAVSAFQKEVLVRITKTMETVGVCDQFTWDLLSSKKILGGEPSNPSNPTPNPEPNPIPPSSITSDSYKAFLHLKDVKVDHGMTIEDGRKMYESMVAFVEDRNAFVTTIYKAEKPEYGSAQCAVTTSAVLEAELNRCGLSILANLFSKSERDKDHFALTHQVEIMLRRLGWFYWLRKDFIGKKGAICMMSGRYDFAGCKQHSGHVYSLYEDRYPENDMICDNGGYKHIYSNKTEGFWLPPGVVPEKRS